MTEPKDNRSMADAPAPGNPRQSANAAAAAVIALVEELIVVIDEENRHLATGAPASTSHLVQRKRELAEKFTQWVVGVRRRDIDFRDADPAVHKRLIESSKTLRKHMNDNVDSLRSSIAATRRRVDAIMRAIREQAAPAPNQYGANARMAAARAPSPAGSGRYL
jgi:hypothetical protein